jgi:uncharacterized membrane protein YgdD (TMEM256/DUF423 family)
MLLAVLLGALGEHALSMSGKMLAIWQTAVQYHMAHALGLFIIAYLYDRTQVKLFKSIGWLMLTGMVLFSGSLYLLAGFHISGLGAITPIGGLCLLGAWALTIYAMAKNG